MRVVIETIPHVEQRYDTCGDWVWHPDGSLHIRISEMPHQPQSEWLVALHEMVEAVLCAYDGIEEEDVTKWDLDYLAAGGQGEPGEAPGSPYRTQHETATIIERIVCQSMGLAWAEHDKTVEEVGNEPTQAE